MGCQFLQLSRTYIYYNQNQHNIFGLMSSFKMANKSASVLHPSTITKPFIFKEPIHQKTVKSKFYTLSHIFLNSMALEALQISWGSEVLVTNPKNKRSEKAHVFVSENIEQNCIELSEHLKQALEANLNKCLMVCGTISPKMIPFEEIEEEETEKHNLEYAYQKNQNYQLISKIINKKLKIQLKLLRCWQSPKLYYLQLTKPINNISLPSILKYLRTQESYRVYPQDHSIEIFLPQSQPIKLQLLQLFKSKTIDTEIIMNLIHNISKITLQDTYLRMPDRFDDLPRLTNEQEQSLGQYQGLKDKQSSTCHQTNFYTDTINDVPVNYLMKKVSTDYQRVNQLEFDLRNMQQLNCTVQQMQKTINQLQTKIETLSIKDKQKQEEKDKDKGNTMKLEAENIIEPLQTKIEELQKQKSKITVEEISENTDSIKQYFDITETNTSNKTTILSIQHKNGENWTLFCPSLKKAGKAKHKLKLVKSEGSCIFYGLINKNILNQKQSAWKDEGTIGCMMNNGRIYLNGLQIESSHASNETLAKQGQSVQIKLNKLFKEISWLVDGEQKIKTSLGNSDIDCFNDSWVTYVEMFNQGDIIQLIVESI